MIRRYAYNLPGEIGDLMRLAEQIRELDEYRAMNAKARYVLDLALEEMASNIIKYGFSEGEDRKIEVMIDFDDRELVLTLRDSGHEFNPLEYSNLPDGDLLERKIGGVGIHLICNMAKKMDYRRSGGLNELKITIDLGEGEAG